MKWSCISNNLLCYIPILAAKIHPHPIIHLEISAWLVFFQCRAIAYLIATALEIAQKCLLLSVSKDLINLIWPTSTWKTYAAFIGKTHVYETAWSLTFFIIRSSLPVGEAEILHASEVGWICYSTQGNYCSSRKRTYLYWTGKSKHWGHLFANWEPLGQNLLEDLKFCVDCLVKFLTCKIIFCIGLIADS